MFLIKKFYRFIFIYGLIRTIFKSIGRGKSFLSLLNFKRKRYISIIGTGQFGFSTILYFLWKNNRNNFLDCYDKDLKSSRKTSRFYKFKRSCNNFNNLFKNSSCKLIYIASNHFTHTPYAIQALENNIDVFVEKPLSVNFEQFYLLQKKIKTSKANIYSGYNRPHSKAISTIREKIQDEPFTINCFVSGHFIAEDHWYRIPEEGTRICGNLGHWIDLSLHLLKCRSIPFPENYHVTIVQADKNNPDDNLSVLIKSDFGDLINLTLSSRVEPFEGINESISILNGNLIVKIDDFRKMTIWQDESKKSYRYFPKDVGHKNSILQPFSKNKRDFTEVLFSTALTLEITSMINNNNNIKHINIKKRIL